MSALLRVSSRWQKGDPGYGYQATAERAKSELMDWFADGDRELERLRTTLAALIAALPRCDWQDSHGLPQLCTRPATQESRSSYGDYVACDECLGCAPDEHDYVDLPYAELLRKVPR